MLADWQLPPGVSRALWDYQHDPVAARTYDNRLADTPLLSFDIQYVLKHCQPPGSLIDLGCGTGRLAIALVKQGYKTVGVDLSPEMLHVLEEKAAALDLSIPCLPANLVELDTVADASFEYAACLFGTLGLIDGNDNRRRFLRHVHRLLHPGGKFILHVHNRWFHLWTRAGRRLLWHNRFGGDFLMPAHEGTAPLAMHLFTRHEVIRELKLAGFLLRDISPITLQKNSTMRGARLFSGVRAYGFLLTSQKPR